MTLRAVALVCCLGSVGCGASRGPRSAVDVTDARCRDLSVLAAIEVYPVGLVPQRRFRPLGTVEVGRDASETERVRTLQAHACELGADAVIGWSERGAGPGRAAAFVHGSTVLATGEDDAVAARGIAVVYTDL